MKEDDLQELLRIIKKDQNSSINA